MTVAELDDRLRLLPPDQADAQARLAAQVCAAAEELPAHLVALGSTGAHPQALAARNLVGRLEGSAASALLQASGGTAADEAWTLQAAVTAIVQLRADAGARLLAALGDTRPLPLPFIDPMAEEHPRPSRVCDEAYLQLRELMDLRESRTSFALDSRAFRRLDVGARDAEIAQARDRGVFTRLVGDLNG